MVSVYVHWTLFSCSTGPPVVAPQAARINNTTISMVAAIRALLRSIAFISVTSLGSTKILPLAPFRGRIVMRSFPLAGRIRSFVLLRGWNTPFSLSEKPHRGLTREQVSFYSFFVFFSFLYGMETGATVSLRIVCSKE